MGLGEGSNQGCHGHRACSKHIPGVYNVKNAVHVHLQWNLSIEDTFRAQLAVLYTMEPLYRGHFWDPAGCPVYSGTSL